MTVGLPTLKIFSRGLAALVLTTFSLPLLAADLTVSAAASLTDAFREIAQAFEKQEPSTKVLLNFAASDALVKQISNGAPVDVFAAADQESMNRAGELKLVDPSSRRNFVSNRMVLVTPLTTSDEPLMRITALSQLKDPHIKRIAIGNPAGVPAGRYAKSALEAAQLWDAVSSKLINAQSVRQCLDYVARGEVDAGFVYATDAAIQKNKVAVAMVVPTSEPISYPIATIVLGTNPEAASKFVAFTSSPAGQAILARYGFQPP